MFNNLTIKQKVIVGVILAVMLIVIGFYAYTKLKGDEEEEIIVAEDFLEVNQEIKQTENTEQEKVNKQMIKVHITGQVKESGILELPEGARIADAILAAGGEKEEANLEAVNLAYELHDGQKIYIPSIKEEKTKEYISSESGNNVIIEEISQGGSKKVNLNEANQEELEQLPGIGPSLAVQILEYRNSNGKFKQVEELKNVKGIGDAKYNNIKEFIMVE